MAKIGLSFSRCVLDLVEGRVNIDDVLVIVARTNFDPNNDDHWKNIWDGYRFSRNAEWWEYDTPEHEKMFRDMSLELWHRGLLHQPRNFGAYVRKMPYYWLETVLPSEELENSPMAKQAWENFQVIAGLANVTLDKNAQ